jgi:hypothetical protein
MDSPARDIPPLTHHRHSMPPVDFRREGAVNGGRKKPFALIIHQIGIFAHMIVAVVRQRSALFDVRFVGLL